MMDGSLYLVDEGYNIQVTSILAHVEVYPGVGVSGRVPHVSYNIVLSSLNNKFYFSIFSSLTIVWNLVLMSTWVPAWLILHHKILVIQLSAKLPNIPKSLGEAEVVEDMTLLLTIISLSSVRRRPQIFNFSTSWG